MAPRKVGYSKKRFPGTAGMRAAAPKTRFSANPQARRKKSEAQRNYGDSPSAPPSAARPGRSAGSVSANPRSAVPTSITSGGRSYFGPASYSGMEYGRKPSKEKD